MRRLREGEPTRAVLVRLAESDHEAVSAAARLAGVSVAEYLRGPAVRRARRELRAAESRGEG